MHNCCRCFKHATKCIAIAWMGVCGLQRVIYLKRSIFFRTSINNKTLVYIYIYIFVASSILSLDSMTFGELLILFPIYYKSHCFFMCFFLFILSILLFVCTISSPCAHQVRLHISSVTKGILSTVHSWLVWDSINWRLYHVPLKEEKKK